MKKRLIKTIAFVLSVVLFIEAFPGTAFGASVPDTPLGAASSLANLALTLGSGEAISVKKTEETEAWVDPPVILSAIQRLTARANSIYNNIAISNVKSYVNIRQTPSEEGEVVGKIYNNAAATILETVETTTGQWYKIKSGTVEGYIKSQYFLTGADAEIRALEVGYVTATVKPSSLRLRKSADLGSDTITVLSGGSTYVVEEQGMEFTKISVDSDIEGYVQNEYIDIKVEYVEAISIAEEQAKLAEQKRLEEEARVKAEKLRKQREEEEAKKTSKAKTTATKTTAAKTTAAKTTAPTTTAPKTTAPTTAPSTSAQTTEPKTTEPASSEIDPTSSGSDISSEEGGDQGEVSALREAIVAEAVKYVGVLEYVLGGNSLETGTDCSGFVQLIFKKFGIKLPRVSDSQGTVGEAVSYEEARPGDLIYYGGHIGIYIGDGKVCHCSTNKSWPNTKISTWNYRAVKSIRNVIGD